MNYTINVWPKLVLYQDSGIIIIHAKIMIYNYDNTMRQHNYSRVQDL